MTTAHRPTWNSAIGAGGEHGNWSSGGVSSQQVMARDLPGHTKMKYRTAEQLVNFEEAASREKADSREDAVVAEVAREQKRITDIRAGATSAATSTPGVLLLKNEEAANLEDLRKKYDDADDDAGDSDLDSSDDEDEDDEALLMKELEKIKKEREEERLRKEAEDADEAAREAADAALTSNPLLNQDAGGESGAVKRKWNDDVVFRNQARGEQPKKRFINDTIRSDFHRRFLNKYVQ